MQKIDLNAPKGKKLEQEATPKKIDFPIERLPKEAQDICREIARTRLLPHDLPGAMVLATAAAALGKGIELDCPPHKTRPNIFLLANARSGTGKSDCARDIFAPIYKAEEQANETHDCIKHKKTAETKLLEKEIASIKGHNEANIEKLAELTEKHEAALKALKPRRIIIEDATEAAMKQTFANNREQLALVSAEGGQVVANLLGRYGDAKGQSSDTVALKAFSGDPDAQSRVGTGETRLKSPCLTIALVLTPDKCRELFRNQRFIEGGLMPRFLIAHSNARPQHDDGTRGRPDTEILERWESTILELVATYRNANAPAVIQCEPEALELFRDHWNTEFVDCFDEIEGDAAFYARHVEQAKRIALILHALKHGKSACHEQLTKTTADEALALVNWFVANQEAAIAEARTDRTRTIIERIGEVARDYGTETEKGQAVTLRNLKRNGIAEDEVGKLVKIQPEKFEIQRHKSKGRPSLRLIIK
tara:strand:+ start:1034 stop:2470 length:1437 start_codon:yes stop_codon:yes gene_type:complete